jgi:hypothetical protein
MRAVWAGKSPHGPFRKQQVTLVTDPGHQRKSIAVSRCMKYRHSNSCFRQANTTPRGNPDNGQDGGTL